MSEGESQAGTGGVTPPPSLLDTALSEDGQHSQADTIAVSGDRTTQPNRPSLRPTPGDSIGRYIVASVLGEGGMGVVLAAYDPKLDRKVALKLLKHQGSSTKADRLRLEREAQALAKLDHPNVVSVYDVGVHDGRLFLAMEFVSGQTLRGWIDGGEGPRPWRGVLEVFLAAGRGLAAAHGAGLIHRDFKPDNVMLDDNGRVRVMDFGLARAELVGPGEDRPDHLGSLEGSLDVELTEAGSLLGTPAYMSPEQFSGGAVEATSDQFSFCVALWEALYGERPFPSTSLTTLVASVTEGRLQPLPRNSAVPSWLFEILRRGLSVDPSQRWPSMDALLEALADDPALRRRRVGLAMAVVGLLVGGAWGMNWLAQRDAMVCTGMDRRLDGVWDEARRSTLEAAFSATGRDYADATWDRAEVRLEAYAQAWVNARVDACEATQRGEQSGQLLDRRMACLDARLVRFEATLDGLGRIDAATLRNAISAVEGLPTLDDCADTIALSAEGSTPDDPELAARVTRVDNQLGQVDALGDLGRYEESLELATRTLAAAEALDHPPVHVRAQVALAIAADRAGERDLALSTFERAYGLALEALMVPEAATSARMMVGILAQSYAKYDEAWAWAVSSEALSRRESPLSHAAHLNNVGILADITGELERARGYHEQALEIRRRELGPRSLHVGHSLNNLATVVARLGDLDAAREHFEAAAEIWTEALGPQHPLLGDCVSNLGEVAKLQGRMDDAQDLFERAHAMRLSLLGPDHVQLSLSHGGLAELALGRGDLDAAQTHAKEAVRIREASLGKDHPRTAYSVRQLGFVRLAQGELDDARQHFERALAIYEDRETRDEVVVNARMGLGQVLLAQGEAEAAVRELERALAFAGQLENAAESEGELRWTLARALWAAGGDAQRALELAEQARQTYAEDSEVRREIEAWLVERRSE